MSSALALRLACRRLSRPFAARPLRIGSCGLAHRSFQASTWRPAPKRWAEDKFDGKDAAEGLNRPSLKTPSSVLLLPVLARPVFPGIIAPVIVSNDLYGPTLQVLRDSMPVHVGVFMCKGTPTVPITTMSQMEQVGLLAQVLRVLPNRPGSSEVVVIGMHRIRAKGVLAVKQGEPMLVDIEAISDLPLKGEEAQLVHALSNELMLSVKELLTLRPMLKDQYMSIIDQADVSQPGDLADCLSGLASGEGMTAQKALEAISIPARMHLALDLMRKELVVAGVQNKVNKKIEGHKNEKNRRFVLLEEMKAIKKELGMDNDEKDVLLNKFQARCNDKTIPEAVMNVISEEMNKLSSLEPSSSEFGVTRNYLDWLTCLPWGQQSTENFELDKAKKILDDDHFGLDDVKERILELIAVGAIKGSVSGKILCLVGPPGVGKTSIGKSIARALDRTFYRFSVGGMSDVAEIKGHRRTYVGAMPGKLIQALKQTQKCNPVILIDEIDKMSRSHTGDPGSALLEVLDPEQNKGFLDHYLDVPFDVSPVLFVVTANSLATIPRPLLDRMEVIELSGYVNEEKLSIAESYLIPRALADCGLASDVATVSKGALELLIGAYCREAGVRNLQKQLEKIMRKATLKIASGQTKHVAVTEDNLWEFVGNPVFTSERYHERTPPGVVMALAWSTMGGSTMYIESIASGNVSSTDALAAASTPGSGTLRTTGSLGDVMTESTNIAMSYARAFLQDIQPENQLLDRARVHMHVPCGGTPKEGPSAGCAMVTSLLSLALQRPVRDNLAMTGEVTLTGKVLRIGGVKEKVIAARRSRCTDVILPMENKADWEELPEFVTTGITPHFAADYKSIYEIALSNEVASLGPQVATPSQTV